MLKKTILVLMAALDLTMSVKAIMTVHTLAEALSQGYKPLPDPNWLYYLATDIPVGDGTWNHTIQFVNPTPKFASLDVKAFRPDKTKEGYIHLSVDLLQAKGDKVYIGSVSFTMIIQVPIGTLSWIGPEPPCFKMSFMKRPLNSALLRLTKKV